MIFLDAKNTKRQKFSSNTHKNGKNIDID